MKKVLVFVLITLAAIMLMATFAGSASAAASPNALNQGTCNAHTNGMPSVDGHVVPGLAMSPFAGAEVPGHMHVPDPPGC